MLQHFIQTDAAMYGANIPPIRAATELEPIPAFLTSVGNNSAVNTYTIAKAQAAPAFPTNENATVSGISPEMIMVVYVAIICYACPLLFD